MRIRDNETYRQALERLDTLRGQRQTTASNEELAELEAAIELYEARHDRPARSTGRPTPDPYGMAEGEQEGESNAGQGRRRDPGGTSG